MAVLTRENLTTSVLVGAAVLILLKFLLPLITRIIKQIQINRALDAFPSMPRHWLYGSFGQIREGGANNRFLEMHLQRAHQAPRGYRIWQGPFISALMVVHPDLIRPVLKVSDPKARIYQETLMPWLGEGLLISRDQKWLRSRRLLTPAFHFDVLKSYMEVFNDATDVFMGKLESLIESEKALRLFENLSLLTLDIILQCAFSYQTDCQIPGKRHPYIVSVYELAQLWFRRVGNILFMVLPFTFWLTKDGQRFKQLCDNVHREADTIIARRKSLLDEHGPEMLSNKKSLDFLDILLTAKDEDGNGMSPIDIRAEVDTFLFEGHDTTSSGLSWTLYLMAKHPHYQKEAQAEIDHLVSELGTDRFDRGSLSRLPLLTRCLKESMRLYPPVPLIGRTLSRDLEIDGHHVLKGTGVMVPIWALHHSEKVWGKDHMEYKPGRFSEENLATQDPFAFIPFSAGPRNCIGQNFALSEEKLVLARLLHRYTFSLPEGSKLPLPSVQVVLRPEEEICLNVTARS